MKKDKKRKAALAAKAKAESLKFQIQWEAKKFFPEMTPELEMRFALFVLFPIEQERVNFSFKHKQLSDDEIISWNDFAQIVRLF